MLHLDASAAALGAALALPADAPAWRATPDALATARTAAVPYTHLTLPTNREAYIDVVARAIYKNK